MDESEKEIRIPPGYQEFREWEREHPGDPHDEILDRIRYLNREIAFVIDPNDPEYLEFLAKCREDTKKLAKALDQELIRRNPPFSSKNNRLRKSKSHRRKISFLIRPPYFSSHTKKGKGNRLQGKGNRLQSDSEQDTFIMHFDQDHHFQIIRTWISNSAGKFNRFRLCLLDAIMQAAQFIEENYGEWEKIAIKIAENIEQVWKFVNN